MSRVIGIIAIKGGVGKTSCTANLGASLANDFDKKVLLVDANFSAPNLGLHFGLSNPEATIHHVLTNKVDVGDAIYEHSKNLHIIPGGFLEAKVNPYKLKEKLRNIKDLYDLVLIDSSPNMDYEILATMIAADELLVVTSPDFPTLSCTLQAVKAAKERNTPITGMILNMVRNKKYELTLDEIEDAAKTPILSKIPMDEKIPESIAYTTPATLYAPSRDAAVEYKKLAAALVQEDYKDPRFLTKIKSMFKKQPSRDEINRSLLKESKLKSAK